MKTNKPKGKTPSLISGKRPRRVDIKQKAKCVRCKDSMPAGADCYGIPRTGLRFLSLKKYCKECFNKIIVETQNDLDEIKNL
jgi:hypothetical protein